MGAIASLGMYDWPELRPAQESFYSAWRDTLRARGVDAPDALAWDREPAEAWTDDALFIGQACGFPFATGMCGQAQLVATPCYSAPGCEGPKYRSILVARRAADGGGLACYQGGVAAVNSLDSHSGYNAFRGRIAQLGLAEPFFSKAIMTGSHQASMEAVASGRADLAAIDCVFWAHAEHCRRPLFSSLQAIDETELAPGLPFITSRSRSAAEIALMREALLEVLEQPKFWASQALRLSGVEILTSEDYRSILRTRDLGLRSSFSATL